MTRLAPKTLFGRIVLIMIAGLVISQILTTAIFYQERARLGLRTAASQLGLRIAEIVKVVDRLPESQRADMVEAIGSPDFVVSIIGAADEVKGDMSSSGEHAEVIADGLRKYLGQARPIRVRVADEISDSPESGEASGAEVRALSVQVGLNDQAWITFKSSLREPSSILTSSRFQISMLIRLVVVLLFSLLAVRLVSKPLRTLAAAAEELGNDIHRPPLAESGPLEVRRAAHAFNAMQERLIRYVQERTRMLAAVSHDLKTPITRLRLRAELLENAELRAKFVKDLEEMEILASTTLDFTRSLEKGALRQEMDLMALLESLQADAQELGHEVTISGQAQRPIRANPQSVKRCIGNLLDNAWKYGKNVRIVVEDSDRELIVSVCDEGPGIPQEELDKVFEPFYRVEGSRNRATGGTGLGLSIAQNYARANGGELQLRNLAAGGLEAILRLPRTPN